MERLEDIVYGSKFIELYSVFFSTSELQEEKRKVEEEAKLLGRDVSLAKEKEAEYAKQAHHKSREIKRLVEKVTALEELVMKFKHERSFYMVYIHIYAPGPPGHPPPQGPDKPSPTFEYHLVVTLPPIVGVGHFLVSMKPKK